MPQIISVVRCRMTEGAAVANLIGIDPDLRIHISDTLLSYQEPYLGFSALGDVYSAGKGDLSSAAPTQPLEYNGLPLSKLHHAAMRDSPLFEQGIKAIVGQTIRLPARERDYPDRDRLAERFARFRG
jgi:hypothetical protein